MLASLHIKNFAVIQEADLELQSGMTVITGETGAGKSIIVDTLSLIFGGRVTNTLIHPAAERAEITATFMLNAEAKSWLEQNDLTNTEECLIRRILTREGKSKNLINGTPCTQQQARELGLLLLNIQGQHEYQNLLKMEKQRALLDNFANANSLVAAVQQSYDHYLKIKKDLLTLEKLAEDRAAKIEFLSYQLRELEDLHLQEGEVATLHQEQKILNNAETIIKSCNAILAQANDENGLNNNLYQAQKSLTEINHKDPRIAKTLELFKQTAINLEEGILELKNYVATLELNEERLSFIEKRLNSIYELARKHQAKPEELIIIINKLKSELNVLDQLEKQLVSLKEALDQILVTYTAKAKKLSQERLHAANKLNKLISEKMAQLNMPGGKFAVNFTTLTEPSLHGLETVEFWVSANPGHPLQPLSQVASGGELSRISLAIQVVTAHNKTTPTLIFDEVDVGIGGKTAEIVGKMLHELGKITQVICITHLPQVAAQGLHHLQVMKNTRKNSTTVSLNTLTANERVMEIARMLGGVKITAPTIAHAKEMLNANF